MIYDKILYNSNMKVKIKINNLEKKNEIENYKHDDIKIFDNLINFTIIEILDNSINTI